MKIGIHLSMWADNWSDDLSVYLRQIRDIGFDGVEMSLYGIDSGRVLALRERFEACGLELTCSTGIGPHTDISSPDNQVRARGEAYLRNAVDMVAALGGALLCGVLYAPWQQFCPEEPRADRWRRSADSLRRIGEYAAKRNIALAVEPLNRFETDFMNTLEEGAAFLDLIGLPNVGLLADTFHQNIEENDPVDALRRAKGRITHFHCSENHRGVPGTGHTDWKRVISALKDTGYDGWLTIESFLACGTQVGKELKIWRNLSDDRMRSAAEGLACLRSHLEGEYSA